MKKIFFCLVIFLLVACTNKPQENNNSIIDTEKNNIEDSQENYSNEEINGNENDDYYEFINEEFKAIFIEQYPQFANGITIDQMNEIEFMEFSETNISDLSDLNSFPNIKELYFEVYFGELDLSIISTIDSLELLSLIQVEYTNIHELKKLFKLKTLNIEVNDVIDIDYIGEVDSLNVLSLYMRADLDLNKLSTITNLRELSLYRVSSVDLSILNEFEFLNKLILSSCEVINEEFNVVDLEEFTANNTELESLTSLKNSVNLKSLTLIESGTFSFENLNSNQLEYLKLKGIEVTSDMILDNYKDLSVIDIAHVQFYGNFSMKGLEKLKVLKLSSINIEENDVDILSSKLEEIELNNSNIVDLVLTENYPYLEKVVVRNSDIERFHFNDFSNIKSLILVSCVIGDFKLNANKSVQELVLNNIGFSYIDMGLYPSLERLNLANNMISEIVSSNDLLELTEIDLSDNRLIDVEFLIKGHDLADVNVQNNNITDISVINEMKNLRYIYVRGNENIDLSNVKNLEVVIQ